MHQFIFALSNIMDKLYKCSNNRALFRFYWETYILSRVDKMDPDIYVVSYPKCGRTWVRFLLSNYLNQIGFVSPRFYDRSLVGIPGSRTVKFDHDQGNWVPAPLKIGQITFNELKYQKKKIILLIRDPRDVLVSSWYHLRYRENIFKKGISEFIYDELVGIKKIVAFMNMWIENINVSGRFHLVLYEQLHDNPLLHFKELIDFLNIPIEMEQLKDAVQNCSFKRMRQIEISGSQNEPWLKPGSRKMGNALKVRKGKIGSYREELSDADLAFVNDIIENQLSFKLPYHK